MIVLNVPAFGLWEVTCREPAQAEENPEAPNRVRSGRLGGKGAARAEDGPISGCRGDL